MPKPTRNTAPVRITSVAVISLIALLGEVDVKYIKNIPKAVITIPNKSDKLLIFTPFPLFILTKECFLSFAFLNDLFYFRHGHPTL